jgi:hypothetical protein
MEQNAKEDLKSQPKIYFENSEVLQKVKTFLEMFELEMVYVKGSIFFREKGSTTPLMESQFDQTML